jgi:hypothetical protein
LLSQRLFQLAILAGPDSSQATGMLFSLLNCTLALLALSLRVGHACGRRPRTLRLHILQQVLRWV